MDPFCTCQIKQQLTELLAFGCSHREKPSKVAIPFIAKQQQEARENNNNNKKKKATKQKKTKKVMNENKRRIRLNMNRQCKIQKTDEH